MAARCPRCLSWVVFVDSDVWRQTNGRQIRVVCWNCGEDDYTRTIVFEAGPISKWVRWTSVASPRGVQ